MAYCRCGDNSDVYLYSHVRGGWELIIAGNVRNPDWKRKYILTPNDMKEWLEKAFIPFDMPEAGKLYRYDNIDDVLKKLKTLKVEGYKVPRYAIGRVIKEKMEMRKNG